MLGRAFTRSEDDYLRTWYGIESVDQIARTLYTSVSAVYRRAAKLGLTHTRNSASDDQILTVLRELHPLGYSDAELVPIIAQRYRTDPTDRHRVGELRRSIGLKSNALSPRRRENVRRKTGEQLAQAGCDSLAQLRNKRWAQWKSDLGWPPQLTVRAVQSLEIFYRHGPLTRVQLCQLLGVSSKKRTAPISNAKGGTVLAELQAAGLITMVRKAVEVQFEAKLHDNPDLSPARARKSVRRIRTKHVNLYLLKPGVAPHGRQTDATVPAG